MIKDISCGKGYGKIIKNGKGINNGKGIKNSKVINND
jgi:hypothetical protein